MSVSATPPEGETYEDYDVIYYSDLLSGGNHLPADGYEITETDNPFTYAATSDTHSAIYKFRYVAGVHIYFQIFPGEYRSGNPFSCRLANATTWERRYNPDQGTMPVGYTVAEGDIIDFEVARLKVATGDNVGKYYTYMKANGTMIYETYVESSSINEEKDLKNGIQLNFSKGDGRYCYIQPLPDTYADYDIVTYSDLLDTGNNHLSSGGITSNSKNEIYHYTATSATHSVIYRFRYVVGTCTYFQMYPGEYCADPFMYRIEPGASANYVKRYSPGNSTISAGTSISSGDELDIEIGRLMVATGDNAGKYYSYFKVNGELKFEVYVATGDITDLKALEDSIQFALNSGNCGFGIKPIPDVLDDYDEVYYEDLLDTGNNHLTAGGVTLTSQNNLYHYTATSESHSAIYKFRWVAGDDLKFQIHPGTYGGSNNFAYRIYNTNFVQRNPLTNSAIGYTINEGDELDLEVARLYVESGGHAGMYYTYFKVDGSTIFEKYVYTYDSNTTDYLADQVQLCLNDSDHYCGIKPIPDTYEEYDEIGYRDLTTINDGGSTAAANPDGWTLSNTGKYCEYAGTSTTKSAIFKFRWTIGDATKMSICFDRKGSSGHALEYMFGAIIEDGKINFRPESGGAKTDIPAELLATLTEGSSHDVEFARLKVASGDNAGKYYVYLKIDEVTLAEGYVAANVVDANGDYTSAPSSSACSLAYMITFNFYGSNGNVISAIPVPSLYEEYDEVGYADLTTINDGGSTAAANPDGWTLSNTGKYCAYAGTSTTKSAIFKFRWTIGDATKMSICFDRKGSS
ncbi:MAG: hypothetical protein J5662_08955, partial [Clostridia bacterium]|nr:hypothetical protein [Clostridia bacterium]